MVSQKAVSLHRLKPKSRQQVAQMAESVDALVSNTSGATRAGSTPALGTLKAKYLIIHLLSFFSFLSEMFPNCPQSSLCIPPKMGHLLHAIYYF